MEEFEFFQFDLNKTLNDIIVEEMEIIEVRAMPAPQI